MSNIEERQYNNCEIKSELKQSRGQLLRTRALETGSCDTTLGLEQVFEAKLTAIRTYEQKLNTITDPYARRALLQMIRKERKELLELAELTDLVEKGPEMNGLIRRKHCFNHEVKRRTGRNVTFWLGAAIVAAALMPSVREMLRPLAVKTVQGVIGLTEQAQGLFYGVREDIEDLVSEAQFERFKDSLDLDEDSEEINEESFETTKTDLS